MEQYFPKRPVKSFLDLEVYQSALALAVFIIRYIIRPDADRSGAEVVLPSGNQSQGDQLSISGNFGSGTAKGQKRQGSEDKRNSAAGKSGPEVVSPSGNQPQGDMPSTMAATASFAKASEGQVGSGTAKSLIFHNMLPCALGLPHLIAEAHSYRFGNQPECLQLLEKAMLHCNKMIVYLEETRDIIETGVEWEKFDETVKKYLFLRRKILNLQRSWKKYMATP
ncbi:MAG: hypothetical protein V1905_03705 [bacterium]